MVLKNPCISLTWGASITPIFAKGRQRSRSLIPRVLFFEVPTPATPL